MRLLRIRLLANHFFYRLSEAGNKKYCYKLHARSGLRFIIYDYKKMLESRPQEAS
jgi:hypothetical protein